MASKVSAVLNQLCDDAFTAALRAADRNSLSEFVADYFCNADSNYSDKEQQEELSDNNMQQVIHNSL